MSRSKRGEHLRCLGLSEVLDAELPQGSHAAHDICVQRLLNERVLGAESVGGGAGPAARRARDGQFGEGGHGGEDERELGGWSDGEAGEMEGA